MFASPMQVTHTVLANESVLQRVVEGHTHFRGSIKKLLLFFKVGPQAACQCSVTLLLLQLSMIVRSLHVSLTFDLWHEKHLTPHRWNSNTVRCCMHTYMHIWEIFLIQRM